MAKTFWQMKEFSLWFRIKNYAWGFVGQVVCLFKGHEWFEIVYEGKAITRCWRCPANYIETELDV